MRARLSEGGSHLFSRYRLFMAAEIVLLALSTGEAVFLCALVLCGGSGWPVQVPALALAGELCLAALIYFAALAGPMASMRRAAEDLFAFCRTLDIETADSLRQVDRTLGDVLRHVEHISKQESETELLHQQAVLIALQNQINPHFLYNTLETIRGADAHPGPPRHRGYDGAFGPVFPVQYQPDGRYGVPRGGD